MPLSCWLYNIYKNILFFLTTRSIKVAASDWSNWNTENSIRWSQSQSDPGFSIPISISVAAGFDGGEWARVGASPLRLAEAIGILGFSIVVLGEFEVASWFFLFSLSRFSGEGVWRRWYLRSLIWWWRLLDLRWARCSLSSCARGLFVLESIYRLQEGLSLRLPHPIWASWVSILYLFSSYLLFCFEKLLICYR